MVARDSVCDDRTLAGAITANANPDESDSWDNMADAIADFVRRIALEIEDGIVGDIQSYMPEFALSEGGPFYGVPIRESAHHTVRTNRTLTRVEDALSALYTECEQVDLNGGIATKAGVSASRQNILATYTEQIAFIDDKASALKFGDDARSQVQAAAAKRREKFPADQARKLYTDAKYKALVAEGKQIETDQGMIELELQSYFDHHAHGASHSDGVKAERVPLKLAPNLEKGQGGYKQIQNMDLFSLSRGN
jgi:hypothetical protein